MTPLVILDVQEAIDQPCWEGKNNPGYLDAIVRLLTHWRERGWPVIHVRHDEPNPQSTYHGDGPFNAIKREVAPVEGETLVVKHENCAFIGTALEAELRRLGATRMVLTGVVIHNSIDATIRAGKALGFEILLPLDATTAVPLTDLNGRTWGAQDVFDMSAAILGSEYAELTTSEDLLANG